MSGMNAEKYFRESFEFGKIPKKIGQLNGRKTSGDIGRN